jgi:hypothetical protein
MATLEMLGFSPWSDLANGLKDLVRRMKERTDSDLDSFMVIGIDFGTT